MPQQTTAFWAVENLTGLARTYEAAIFLEAALGELAVYYEEFQKLNNSSVTGCPYPDQNLQRLQHAMDRARQLRSSVRDFLFNLGDRLLWASPIKDGPRYDEKIIGGRKHTLLPLNGFFRAEMIDQGNQLIKLLREGQSVVASIDIAADDLEQAAKRPTVSDDGSQEPEHDENALAIEPGDEEAEQGERDEVVPEEPRREALWRLSYWAMNDIERIRDVLKSYSRAIGELKEAEDAQAEPAK